MNNKKFKILFALGATLCSAVLAQAQHVFDQTNTVSQPVPSSEVPATSSILVSGLSGNSLQVQVMLNIAGGYNGTLYAALTDPTGNIAVLLNLTGVSSGNAFGYSDAGFNVVLSDGASNIHNYQNGGPGNYTLVDSQLTGTWAPDGRNLNPFTAPAGAYDTTPTSAGLSVFNDQAANGLWTLSLVDTGTGGGSGSATLVSWGLLVVTVPEPQTWVLVAGGLGVLLMSTRRPKL